MKRTIVYAAVALVAVAAIAAAGWVYNATIVNTPALAYNQNFTINMNTTPNANGIKKIAAQAVYSSATLPTDTFNDGRVSTATLTVSSNVGLSSASAVDQITIADTSVIRSSAASDSIVVASTNGLSGAYLTLNGTVLANNGWRVDKSSDTAADIAAQINTYVYQVIATAASSTVTLVARATGVNGNAYTLTASTPTALVVGSANFTGGQNPAFQNQYLAVNGVNYARGNYWNFPNSSPETSTGTAVSLAALLNNISGIQASAAGSVVYATATVYGSAANSFTLVSSTPSAMTVATPTFTGGVDNAVITINGVALTQGAQWNKGASVTLTAASIVSAINGNSALSPIVAAANIAGVVFSTSTSVGTASNYSITSSAAGIVAGHATYVGGLNAAYTLGNPNIFIPGHGYATSVPVLLTGSSAPAPLSAGTTYYVISVDANDMDLALSSANAQAGTYITLTSSSTTGPHTTTLTPLAYTGTAGLAWYGSIDCLNYNPVNVSSVTISSPSGVASSLWDFGTVNYKCLQLQAVAPTQGGLKLVVTVNGKD